jgi:hypothetical protein
VDILSRCRPDLFVAWQSCVARLDRLLHASGRHHRRGRRCRTRLSLGGQTYIVDAESIPNVSAALKQDPQSDVAQAASFLKSKGYHVSESIMFQRFVRLVDDAKRNEFILLYVEDADAGAPSETERAMQEFSRRALKGFTVLK